MTINDATHTCEIKSRIATAKAAFSKKKRKSLHQQMELKGKSCKCHIWSIAFMELKPGHFKKQIRNAWRVLNMV
jgi:hypothetical protein